MMEYLMQICSKEILEGGDFNLNAGASFPESNGQTRIQF